MISIFKPKTSFLLALLVITGLAGRPSFKTISGTERRFLTHHVKETKLNLVKSIKGLSEKQLTFKPAPDKWSIQECVQHQAISENELWKTTEAVIRQPANGEKRSEIKMTDDQILEDFSDRSQKFQSAVALLPKNSLKKTTEDALEEFKVSRNKLIKFTRVSTDDLRHHVSLSPGGASDAYQLILMISAHTQRHILQIEEIKKDKDFPKE